MSHLFTPLTFRDLTLKNRLVVAPMCQYSARHGFANDWHFAHLGRFAIGGFGLVFVEATAVSPEGRITYADTGLWSDEQVEPYRRIVDFLHSQGAAAGVQLAHAGRKASSPVPFRPNPTDAEKVATAYEDWQPIAPSPLIHSERMPGYKIPREMSLDDIRRFKQSYIESVYRSEKAGFDVIEIHAAHGYLLNQFLSPLANKREDDYGGSRENRMRLLLELAAEVRAAWPAGKPLFVRISASDNHPDGWTIEDSIVLAGKLKALEVDAIDVSSGGFDGAILDPKSLYQLPLSTRVPQRRRHCYARCRPDHHARRGRGHRGKRRRRPRGHRACSTRRSELAGSRTPFSRQERERLCRLAAASGLRGSKHGSLPQEAGLRDELTEPRLLAEKAMRLGLGLDLPILSL